LIPTAQTWANAQALANMNKMELLKSVLLQNKFHPIKGGLAYNPFITNLQQSEHFFLDIIRIT